jgi:oligopeptide transport system ATP-binding protein
VTAPLLDVENLEVRFWTRRGTVHAVNDISFSLSPGETLGIVGESGCGKSVTALALMGILPRAGRVTAGTVRYDGRDLYTQSDSEWQRFRGKEIAMIFQDPMTSLNPVLTVGSQLREAIDAHLDLSKGESSDRVVELLDRVGIPHAKARAKDYPHQFSGGMRQRVMIAIALACEPKVLIADEPTTALDVTIQAQILDLLRDLVTERDTALILITHDLGVVAGMCERIQVMYAGTVVETGSARPIFASPRHPYTLGLLQSVPRLDTGRRQALQPIEGAPPNMLSEPASCPFAPRCRYAQEDCLAALPLLRNVGPEQRAACFHPAPADEWARSRLSGAA